MSTVKQKLEEWATRIQQASKVIDTLEARLQCRQEKARQDWRHIPVFANMEFVIPTTFPQALQMQEQNWLNGGEDVFCQGVMSSVYAVGVPAGQTEEQILNASKDDGGYGYVAAATSIPTYHVDFGWNVRVGRTGQYLLSPANNGMLIGSTTLRKDRAGKVHWFSVPLRVPAGENIVTQMRPLLVQQLATFPIPSVYGSDTQWRVSLSFFGHRTGALHDR